MAVGAPKFQNQSGTLSYSYSLMMNAFVLDNLSKFDIGGFYAKNLQARHALSLSASSEPGMLRWGIHCCGADAESSVKKVVDVPFSDDVTRTKMTVLSSHSQTYKRQEALLLVFKVDEMQNPLHVFSRKHEHELLEAL